MRYSHKHKFILINNWKCGCSSICGMFDEYTELCGKVRWSQAGFPQRDKCVDEEFGLTYNDVVHARASDIKKLFEKKGWNFNEYIKIISVRNPWDRMVSLYSYQIKMGEIKGGGRGINSGGCFKHYPNNPDKETKIAAFPEFARRSIPKWQNGIVNRWNTYEMIHDEAGAPLIDYVVRLENLEEDLGSIVKKHFPEFHIDYSIKQNTSVHDHYSTYYDEEAKAIVADLLSYDIERWGYKFENE